MKKAFIFIAVLLVVAVALILPNKIRKQSESVGTEELAETEDLTETRNEVVIAQGSKEEDLTNTPNADAQEMEEGAGESSHEHEGFSYIDVDRVPSEALEALDISEADLLEYAQSFVNGNGFYGACSHAKYLSWERDKFNENRIYCYFRLNDQDETGFTIERYEDEIYVTKGTNKNL